MGRMGAMLTLLELAHMKTPPPSMQSRPSWYILVPSVYIYMYEYTNIYRYVCLCKDTYVRRLLCEEGPLAKPIPKESPIIQDSKHSNRINNMIQPHAILVVRILWFVLLLFLSRLNIRRAIWLTEKNVKVEISLAFTSGVDFFDRNT